MILSTKTVHQSTLGCLVSLLKTNCSVVVPKQNGKRLLDAVNGCPKWRTIRWISRQSSPKVLILWDHLDCSCSTGGLHLERAIGLRDGPMSGCTAFFVTTQQLVLPATSLFTYTVYLICSSGTKTTWLRFQGPKFVPCSRFKASSVEANAGDDVAHISYTCLYKSTLPPHKKGSCYAFKKLAFATSRWLVSLFWTRRPQWCQSTFCRQTQLAGNQLFFLFSLGNAWIPSWWIFQPAMFGLLLIFAAGSCQATPWLQADCKHVC